MIHTQHAPNAPYPTFLNRLQSAVFSVLCKRFATGQRDTMRDELLLVSLPNKCISLLNSHLSETTYTLGQIE